MASSAGSLAITTDKVADRPAVVDARLDLRGTPCPLNFIRVRLALETIGPGRWLQVLLDEGEPEAMVSEGLLGDGHRVETGLHDQGTVQLHIQRDGG